MKLALANEFDLSSIAQLDAHIPTERLEACIRAGQVYVLKNGASVVGVLRYSLFWQTIPFLDLIYLDAAHRRLGHGSVMMQQWEHDMAARGYRHVMTSTQADEDAWQFYEKRGYRKAGGFFPPEQDAEEWIYQKELPV